MLRNYLLKTTMKSLFLMITFLYVFYATLSNNYTKTQLKVNIFNELTDTIYNFTPHRKLKSKEIWSRVSELRFECSFLRLAVEWRDFEYVLIEMDGDKRELARNRNYEIISKVIVKLTLRSIPKISG